MTTKRDLFASVAALAVAAVLANGPALAQQEAIHIGEADLGGVVSGPNGPEAGNRTPFHGEGGKGNTSKIVHFQLRPDPLAD